MDTDNDKLLDDIHKDISEYAEKISDLIKEVKEKYKGCDIEPIIKKTNDGECWIYLRLSMDC